MEPQEKPKKNVYEIITEHIVNFMDDGIIPWQMSWVGGGLPRNAITGKPYRGPNVPLLAAYAFSKNLFITEAQLKERSSRVVNGQYPEKAIYWEWKEDENGGTEKRAVLRYERVYNISQCEGLSLEEIHGRFVENPLAMCKDIVIGMDKAPRINYGSSYVAYQSAEDTVFIPSSTAYPNPAMYYYDLFYLLIQSTGHPSRLNRPEHGEKEEKYSTERLIADMGAHYLCFHAGLTGELTEQDDDYLYDWVERFSNDPKLFVSATTKMQKAVDFILNPPTNTETPKEKQKEEKAEKKETRGRKKKASQS